MSRIALLSAVVSLVAWSAVAGAAPVLFGTTGQFQVLSKGGVDPAGKVYRSLTPPWQFLVETPVFPRPVLITTGPMSARLVDPARVTPDAADPEIVKVDTGGAMDEALALRPDGPNLVLDRNGLIAMLAPSPPVLGDRTLEQVAAALPEYRRLAAAYTPDKAAVEKLQRATEPAELLVFFGSWCSHCEQFVPRLIRVLQDAKGTGVRVTFHGVAGSGERDPLADELQIRGLPTGILKRDGKEVARLLDTDWDAPESSLTKKLAEKPAQNP